VEEKPAPLPEVGVNFTPEERGVESLARQVRFTGRAYPVFDIAQLVLSKPERYRVTFSALKKADGQVAQALWTCSVDETLWMSQEEAIQHLLRKHFEMFYQAEKTPTEPPKGTYTFVAQCGLSGVILGPPNFHDYQTKLHKLHASRFSRMPFEAFKAKIRIVRDEATVKRWVEEQSWRTEYVCLNVPEAMKLGSREEAERHFREVHAGNLVREVESWSGTGVAAQGLPSHVVRALLRRAWEDQRRFPLKVVTVLSQQFAGHGLQFFKVNRTFTHVSVARPHYLDVEATPVSDGVKRIVQYVEAHEGCSRKHLVEALAPTPPRVVAPASGPAPAGEVPATPGVEAPAPAPAAVPAEPQPTPEQTMVISDLHWLIHQGHVIEFANGRLEAAKKPKPKPERPAKPVPVPASEGSAPAVSAEVAAVPAAVEVGERSGEELSGASSGPAAAEPEVPAVPAGEAGLAPGAAIPEPQASGAESAEAIPEVPPPAESAEGVTLPPSGEVPERGGQGAV
jgi:hypothetical protein